MAEGIVISEETIKLHHARQILFTKWVITSQINASSSGGGWWDNDLAPWLGHVYARLSYFTLQAHITQVAVLGHPKDNKLTQTQCTISCSIPSFSPTSWPLDMVESTQIVGGNCIHIRGIPQATHHLHVNIYILLIITRDLPRHFSWKYSWVH